MSPLVLAILMFVCLFIALLLGHPLAFALGGLAVIFGLIGWGPGCFLMFGNRIYDVMNNYTLVAVPLFVLMAQFLTKSGVADGLFSSMRYLLGPLRGGVAMAVIAVSTVFAACTGIIGASVVTMGVVALPLLFKYGYQKELSLGAVCAGGTLGIIIAPSIMLVIMGAQAGLSVGKLFMSALFPGLILAALYLIYIAIICWRHPELGPAMSPEERKAVPVSKRLSTSLVNLVPPGILIVAVLGSIFLGVATPTEASGVGAFIAFLLVLAYRRFSWEGLKDSLVETGKISSMVFIILFGATCFTGVFLGVGGGKAVEQVLIGSGLGRWWIFAIMMLIVFVLGMFIDWIGIVMVTFPIFLPIAESLGFDMLWFVTLIAVNLQASFLTPPFGYALFYIKGVVPQGVVMEDIYRGIVPFVILMLIGLAVCALVPPVILWLPAHMIK